MAEKNTLYIDRLKVREIITGVSDEHVHVTEGILAEIDALPATALPEEWVEFYRTYRPTNDELQELARQLNTAR